MLLVLTKQYRQEEELITPISKKIKKSKTMERKYGKKGTEEANTEIYVLDDIEVYFNLGTKGGDNAITIKDKEGNEIYKMDCHYDYYDRMQTARNRWFSGLLDKARNSYDKRTTKAQKFEEATQEANRIKKENEAKQTVETNRNTAIEEALSKLR